MTKILKRLHLAPLAYGIEKAFARKDRSTLPTPDEALTYLNGLSPDSHGSCVCNHKFSDADCDLEIIVPCYNVEPYVEECMESILSQQTRFSFFITVVNDGSKDGTGEVLKRYTGLSNVRVITQENRGFSGARNAGITQAHGRYLMFVDSDDVLLPDAVESLMAVAERTGADIVDSGHIRFADIKKAKTFYSRICAKVYDRLQKPQTLPDDDNSPRVTGYPWGKVLKRELFSKVEFPSGYWFEDTLVWMVLESQCTRKATTSVLTYCYRMNPDSITHTFSEHLKTLDAIFVTLQLLNDRRTFGLEFEQWQYDMLLQQMHNNFARLDSLPEAAQRAAFAVESNLIKNEFREWSTDNPHVRPLEDMLRSGNFHQFRLWCKWH